MTLPYWRLPVTRQLDRNGICSNMTESLTKRRLWIYVPDNPVLRCHRGTAANRSLTNQGV